MANSTPMKRGRPPINNRVIRVGGAIALPPLLRECGIDADALIAEVGLQATAFDHPYNVIPFARLGELARLAADHTGLADIGLRQHEFQLVTVGQLDGLRLICRREGGGHGLRRKALVRLGGGRAGHAGRDQR